MKLNFTKHPNQLLIAIIIVGLLARLAAALYIGNEVFELPGTFDQISYHNLAIRLVNGYGFSFGETWWPMTAVNEPTAHWSFIYTLFLAGIYKLFGTAPLVARLLQVVVVGILQPYLAYLIGRHVFNEAVGLFAAALTVLYSYFVYYAANLMTEPFYITAIMASLYLTIRLAEAETVQDQRKLAIYLGLVLGITVLLRQLFILFIPLLILWLIWARYRRSGRWPVMPVLVVSLIVAAMILPFTIYNYMRFDRFVLLNTNAGYAFYWANHPVYGTHYQPLLDNYVALVPTELQDLDEAALDQALLRLGVEIVLKDPLRFIQLSFSRIPVYFMFWPSAESGMISNVARVTSFGILWPFMLYGLFYALLHRSSGTFIISSTFLLILFATAYSLVHLLSWSLIRYRLPVDAVMLIFAGLAVWQLSKKLKFRHLKKGSVSRIEKLGKSGLKTSSMRILFVVPYTPNLIRVRPYSLIRSLSDRGHQVTVLTLSAGPADQADGAALAEYCQQVISLPISRWRSLWNCLVALPSKKPLQSVYSWQPGLADQLDTLTAGQNGQVPFDVVHVEHLRGTRYGLHILERSQLNKARIPIVWDSVDCISYLFEQAADQSESLFGRWVTRFELKRTRYFEGWLLSQFNHILVTSRVDKQALIDLSPPSLSIPEISILPNGVDLDYFRPSRQIMRDPATLVVSGKMSYHANVTMVLYLVQEIMPSVWSSRPDVKLMIVGKDPSSDIQKLDQHPAISVTGMVKDIRPYLQKATVAVAPLTYGAGVQNKVLEAMACATPVVATPRVTMGLDAVAGRDLLIAQDAADFAEQITELFGDPDRQQAIGSNGRAYVEGHHQWKTIAQQLEEIYQAAVYQDR